MKINYEIWIRKEIEKIILISKRLFLIHLISFKYIKTKIRTCHKLKLILKT